MARMARRQALVAVVGAGVVMALAGYGARAGPVASDAWRAPSPMGSGRHTLAPIAPAGPDALVAERAERTAEASTSDRRTSTRDGRGLELLAVIGIGLGGIAALVTAMARRRHARPPTRSRGLAPARAPPRLLPS